MPLSFIIGGGVVVGVAITAALKKKCSICDSYLTLNEKCFVCGDEVCGGCGTDIDPFGRMCSDEHGDIDAALDKYSDVELYSKNYKGKVPLIKKPKKISTAYYKDKDEAEDALRFIAALNKATSVQKVSSKKGTGEDGNYKFSIWSYEGEI